MIGKVSVKAVVFDVGGVLLPSPRQLWKGISRAANFEFLELFLELESELGLAPDSIWQLYSVSKELQNLYAGLERGELTLDDYENIFTHFYNKKVIPKMFYFIIKFIISSMVDKQRRFCPFSTSFSSETLRWTNDGGMPSVRCVASILLFVS